MDSPQQFGEGIVLFTWLRQRPCRKRTAKRGGYPGLVGQIINLDVAAFHWSITLGVLI